MKKRFGPWPKIALLIVLASCLAGKFIIADNDLKGFKGEQSLSVPAPDAEQVLNPAPLVYDVSEQGASTPTAYAQSDGTIVPDQADSPGGIWGFVRSNWAALLALLIALVEGIVRLTPTEKDNSIFGFLKYILDRIIPNARAGGGTHT